MSRIGPRAHDEHCMVASCGRGDGRDWDEAVRLGRFETVTDLKDQRHRVAGGQVVLNHIFNTVMSDNYRNEVRARPRRSAGWCRGGSV